MKRKFRVTINGETYEVEVEEIGGTEDRTSQAVSETGSSPHKQSASPAERSNDDRTDSAVEENDSEVEEEEATPAETQKGGGDKEDSPPETEGDKLEKVEAPMAGKILDLKVSRGDKINQGDLLMVLEAMKMENEISAPAEGRIKNISVTSGQSVDAGDILLTIE
ncbi:biotin/lipoyl-containing protein [Halarsenatibacter silvermanii]|uniref:Biotin carboxyl carrier protein n=1 Tax=Halarsenatibacter silvermanii TaxID=321763 RepID=A0A1G9I8N5_9FIRM|nr:biotin/lipoyl-containing protein [Halarsenatibacter silvermanii]SDL21630.1 Biotin carboxyl carrier protein [Halarsenatibacter silvermanii]